MLPSGTTRQAPKPSTFGRPPSNVRFITPPALCLQGAVCTQMPLLLQPSIEIGRNKSFDACELKKLLMLQGASALQMLQVRKALLDLRDSECTLAVYCTGWKHLLGQALTMLCHADFSRPAEKISYPQQCAVTATGLIWTRFSTVINPVRPVFSCTCHCPYLMIRPHTGEPSKALLMSTMMQISSAALLHAPLHACRQPISAGRR